MSESMKLYTKDGVNCLVKIDMGRVCHHAFHNLIFFTPEEKFIKLLQSLYHSCLIYSYNIIIFVLLVLEYSED